MLPPNHQTQSETHLYLLMSQNRVTWRSVLVFKFVDISLAEKETIEAAAAYISIWLEVDMR